MHALTLGPPHPRTHSRNRYAHYTYTAGSVYVRSLHIIYLYRTWNSRILYRYIMHVIRTPRTRFNYRLSNSQLWFCIHCITRIYILGGVLQRAHIILYVFYNYSRHIVRSFDRCAGRILYYRLHEYKLERTRREFILI